MNERTFATPTDEPFIIWPTVAAILLQLITWFYYLQPISLLLEIIGGLVFFVFMIFSLVHFYYERRKRGLSYAIPTLLLGSMALIPVRDPVVFARHYVEFIRHEKKIILDLDRESWPPYREWNFDSYTVLYDAHDDLVNGRLNRILEYESKARFANFVDSDNKNPGGPCFHKIYRVREHVYIGIGDCVFGFP